VPLALTEEDFRRHSEEGRCVAVRVLRNEQDDDASEPGLLGGRAGLDLQSVAEASVTEISLVRTVLVG